MLCVSLGELANSLGARRCGSGYVAKCPAHEDKRPSLAINEKDGKTLFYCFAGCTQEEVISALREMGMWRSTPPTVPQQMPAVVAKYDYTDEQGQILYRVVRYQPKDFRPQYMAPDGRWMNGYGEVRRVLYRLPEVIKAETVLIVEGEKDANTLRSIGYTATTNAGGANAWRTEFAPFFAGKRVHVIPDNDKPGREWGQRVAIDVSQYAADTRMLLLDGAKDVSEWFAQGNSLSDFDRLLGSRPSFSVAVVGREKS